MFQFLADNNRGGILIYTAVIIAILSMIGATFVRIITSEYSHAAWQLRWIQAYYIAEAGITQGCSTLKNGVKGSSDNLGNFVVGPDGEPNTDDDGVLSFGPNVDFGAGSFSVRIADNDDGDGDNFSDNDDILMFTSTGVVRNVERTINVTLIALPFVPNFAVIANGDFEISGNPNIKGDNGTVFTNNNLTLSGSPVISQDAIAGGSVNVSGHPTIAGEILNDFVTIPIPPVDPQFYRVNADYELRSDGGVFDVAAGTLTYPGTFNGWQHVGSRWKLAGNTGYDGTYYMEGNVEIVGGPGNAANPWRVSIIATGNIRIAGNPYMLPETPDLLFVAGRDIKIGAASTQHYEGVILAHEQVEIGGTPTIEGAIIVENAENLSNLVRDSDVVGNATISYSGSLLPPLPKIYTGQLGVLSRY